MFAGKNLRMTQKKASRADFNQKTWRFVLQIDACADAKQNNLLEKGLMNVLNALEKDSVRRVRFAIKIN